MAITRSQSQNQLKGNRDKTKGKYDQSKPVPMKLHPSTDKATFPSMGHYIEASKEPRHKVKGTGAMRQALTFGKNG